MLGKLKSFEFKGIKNIDVETKIEFISKKKISNEELENNFTKAIYGPNGSGKTAFVKAIVFYQNIVLNDNFLIKHDDYLQSYINDISDEILFKMVYLAYSDSSKMTKEITHEIRLNKNLEIKYEKIHMLSSIVEIENGVLKEIKSSVNMEEEFQQKIYDETKNLLKKSSFISLFSTKFMYEYKNNISFMSERIFFNMLNTNIIVEEKDELFLNNIINQVKNVEEFKVKAKKNLNINKNLLDINRVTLDDKDSYEEEWNRVLKFLKIIKPQIKKMIFEYKKDNNSLIPTILIDYESQKVNIDLESVGIKKAINLYQYINRLTNNDGILIVDELDAHLHDVLLGNLLEYIIDNERGQFIFTIHNLSAMDILKNKSDSISILNLNKKVINWKKNGNYNPKNSYKLGYLTDDFGYGFFDLDEVFSDEE